MNEKLLHYKDVVLADPVYSEIRSRDELKETFQVDFLGYKFKSPVIAANMKCSIDFETAEKLDDMGYFYILHRFYDYIEIYKWLVGRQKYEGRYPINSISLGVREKDKEFVGKLCNNKIRVDYITIDIAFGHSILMKEMIECIKRYLPDTKIIAGNVCTSDAVKDLTEWGADAIKVGLSCGKSCLTYNSTGVGSPMFSANLKCSEIATVPIIADGGIRENNDICKALVAGATMVMIGSEFVKCIDSPAEGIYEPQETMEFSGQTHVISKRLTHKIYFGSASAKNKGVDSYVEGLDEVLLPCNGLTYEDYYRKIQESIVSCMSYHNIRDVSKMNTINWSKHSL